MPLGASSQQYSYVHYDTKDGLAGSTVHGIMQDLDGFIWFATETGLSRFDGTHFKNFTRADGLPSNEVFGAFVDSKNRIWFTSFKNAICYYWKGSIHNQQNDSVLKKISLNSIVSAIGENLQGDILIACIATKEFLIIKNNSEISSLGDASFDVAKGLASFLPKIVLLPEEIRTHISLDSGVYWPWDREAKVPLARRPQLFSRDDSAFYFPGNGQPGYRFRIPAQTRNVGYLDDSSITLLGTYSRAARVYDLRKRQFTATYLPDYTVNTVFKDKEGCIWFSTREAGVFKLSNPTFKNNSFYDAKMPLAVLSIHKMNQQIYVGTSNSLYWKLRRKQTDPGKEDWYQPVSVQAGISFLNNEPYRQLINYSGSDFFHLGFKEQSIKTLFVFNDTLLTSSSGRSSIFYIPSGRKICELYNGRSTAAYKQGNTYYIGTLNGLYTITGNNKVIFLGDENPLFKNRISSFAESADGTLWVTTYEAGIIGYRNAKIIANITQRNGNLSSNICRCIFISGNTLWVGTEKGLNKVDIRPGHYRATEKFTANDGLGTDIINCIYAEGNRVYVGTAMGLTYFDQDKVPQHSICYIRLTSVMVSGKQADPEKDHIVMEHEDNNIRFEFSGISFLSSGDITYQYRLLGLSDEWHAIKEKVLNYPLLPSGLYILQLQAINKFNDRSKVLEYAFEIKKTLWETPWFIAILFVAGASLIWLALQQRIRQVRKKEKEKQVINQKIAGLEQMALRAQMNPHFIFNCLNSIQHYIIKQDIGGANFYLSQFASLVRKTLENSSKIYVPFTEEITYLTNYIELEKLQLDDRFTYTIKADVANKEKIMIPNMVIQPYIENVFKHGVSQLKGGGRISLTFTHEAARNILECIVEDNGQGITGTREMRKENSTHLSKAMSITSNRIEILNQLYAGTEAITVIVENITEAGQVCGTRVILRFPLNNLNHS